MHQANLGIVQAQGEDLIACTSYPTVITHDYKVFIEKCDVDEFVDPATMSVKDFSDDFAEFAVTIMNELQLEMPSNAREGLDLYIHLINEVENLS